MKKRLYSIIFLLSLISAGLFKPTATMSSAPQPIQFPSGSSDVRIAHQLTHIGTEKGKRYRTKYPQVQASDKSASISAITDYYRNRITLPGLSGYSREITPQSFQEPSLIYLSRRMDRFHETLDVYTDADAAGNHFSARGRFNIVGGGDYVPPMIEDSTESPYSGVTCIKASFRSNGPNWGGWYFMNGSLQGNERSPGVNWGDVPNAGIDMRGATKLTFYARGAEGDERVEFFALGVGRSAESGVPTTLYPDSSPKASLGYVTLTTSWKRYAIDLAGKNLDYVLGGFGWATAANQNRNRDITFYLDDIQFDKPRLDEPRFLVSYETIRSSNPFDRVSRNVAFTYDNAVALIAFLNAGERGRARLIADAMVYAQENDRYYDDGRIRNAYQGGDLILPPGWAPNGKTGTARMPGFNDPGAQLWMEDEFQVSTHTGNVAWAMLGLLAYYRWAGGDKYLNASERMGEWVETNCRDTRGAGGYTGGFDGWEPTPTKRFYKATEHNIDLVAAFHQLFLITGDEKWRERATHAKQFVLAMWDAAERKFWTGAGEDGVTIGQDVIPLDIQAWAILALAEESQPFWQALEYAEIHHKVGDGYDFNQDRDGVWHEGTAQMAAVYHFIGNQERRLAILNYLSNAQQGAGGTHATDEDGERCSPTNPYCGLTTGFTLNTGEPWLYFRRLHVGATAWQALAEQGANPFRITRTADAAAISGRVTEASGAGIGGVAVKLGGSEFDVTLTDNDGNYSFSNLLEGGDYIITPSKALLSFAPKIAAFNNISGAQTANFTSVPLPIITSIKPVYALQGSVVSNFAVTGVNLTGSTFSFAPTPSAVRVDSATVNPNGTSATLRLTVSSSAFGTFALVASNSVGISDESLLPSNTLRILDPRLDTDGDGFPDGVEIEIGSNRLMSGSHR